MKLCVLGSGSRGNCLAVWEDGRHTTMDPYDGQTGLLVDVGLSYRESLSRLEGHGIFPGIFRHCLISHSHGDHHTSIRKWIEDNGTQMWSTSGTMEAIPALGMYPAAWHEVTLRQVFKIEQWQVYAVPTVHNAKGACTYIIRSPAGKQLALFVETGVVTPEMWQAGRNSDAYLIEANHDKEMCAMSERPEFVNQRTMLTHLNNKQAAALVEHLDPTAKVAVMVHLSQENNEIGLVEKLCVRPMRSRTPTFPVYISTQDEATEVFEV